MAPESNWGDLEPEAVDRIKHHIRSAVAEGIEEALRADDMRNAIASGVANGIKTVAEDEELFGLVIERLSTTVKSVAVKSTGRFIIDKAMTFAKLAFWAGLGFTFIGSLFGWPGVVAVWKLLLSKAPAA